MYQTYQSIAVACCFMIAIVVVESWRDDSSAPSGRWYFVAWLAGAMACGWIAWSFPYQASAMPTSAQGKAIYAARQKAGRVGAVTQTLHVFQSVRIMIHGGLGIVLYVWLRDAKRAAEALSRAEIERAEAQRKLIASRIEAVEAEVDPAFMFSTLETIEETYDRDRAAADAMLDELIAFLRAAIPRLRGTEPAATPKGAEVYL